MKPEELAAITPRQFHNKLTGYLEIREANERAGMEKLRAVCSYILLIPQWKSNQRPDIKKLMPFPWDEIPAPLQVERTEEEMAREWYTVRKAWGIQMGPEKDAIIEKHYRPEWDNNAGSRE